MRKYCGSHNSNKCHSEPCAELDSVLFQNLMFETGFETLK
jgi:hypothetical protein